MAWKNKEKEKTYKRKWFENYRKQSAENRRKSLAKIKQKLFDLYGHLCSCCGEADKNFLTLDHINGDGYKHREKIKTKYSMYKKVTEDFDKTKYQILCFNCNCAKRNNKTCPHQHETLIDKYIQSLGG